MACSSNGCQVNILKWLLEEDVYVEQPQGYEVLGEEHKVYRMKHELYGLKQAPRG